MWLGNRDGGHESFPSGTLNERQLRTLLAISEKGNRGVISLDIQPAVLQITEDIVEIHTRFGMRSNELAAAKVYFWINSDGKFLAAVEEKYEGPAGVHRPGDKSRKWAVAYLRRPDMSSFAASEEKEYERMWSLGGGGAVDDTRKFIRENWVEVTV